VRSVIDENVVIANGGHDLDVQFTVREARESRAARGDAEKFRDRIGQMRVRRAGENCRVHSHSRDIAGPPRWSFFCYSAA